MLFFFSFSVYFGSCSEAMWEPSHPFVYKIWGRKKKKADSYKSERITEAISINISWEGRDQIQSKCTFTVLEMFVGSPRVPRQDGEKKTGNLRRESPVREFPSPFHTGLPFPITSYSCIHPKTRELLPWRQSSFPATINEGCPPQGFPEKLARNYPPTFYSIKMQQDSREQEFLLTLPGHRSKTLAQFPLPHVTNLLESPWWNSCQTHARGELSAAAAGGGTQAQERCVTWERNPSPSCLHTPHVPCPCQSEAEA